MTRDIIFRQNFVNFGRRTRLNFSKNGGNFQKSAKLGKRLFAFLKYSKSAFESATFEKLAINPTKIIFFWKFRTYFENYLRDFFLRPVRWHSISVRGMLPFNMLVEYMCFSQKHHHKAYIIGAKVIEIGNFGRFSAEPKIDVPYHKNFLTNKETANYSCFASCQTRVYCSPKLKHLE